MINNAYSLLDVADLVFIDAPGAGFSRIAGKDKEKAFWGVDNDSHAFARFIQQFLNKYNRWNSPKYLFGESYGTTRSAVLANELASSFSIDLNGVVLLSTILNFDLSVDSPSFNPGVDTAYVTALPTMAATAWYHNRLPGTRPAELETFLREVARVPRWPSPTSPAASRAILRIPTQSASSFHAIRTGAPGDGAMEFNLYLKLAAIAGISVLLLVVIVRIGGLVGNDARRAPRPCRTSPAATASRERSPDRCSAIPIVEDLTALGSRRHVARPPAGEAVERRMLYVLPDRLDVDATLAIEQRRAASTKRVSTGPRRRCAGISCCAAEVRGDVRRSAAKATASPSHPPNSRSVSPTCAASARVSRRRSEASPRPSSPARPSTSSVVACTHRCPRMSR